MAKFIYKHRRGTADQWNDVESEIIPLEGEIVLELDNVNKLHKLKIGDGETPYKDLKYLMAGDEIVTQVLAQAKPRVVTINLTTDWIKDANDKYGQTITLDGITKYSRLDLQPSADMLAEFKQLNLVFVTENNNGVITVYSVGDMPLKSYEMQATIVETEFEVNCDKIVGIPVGTPTTQSDWNQIDETKADYIKNKPEIPSVEGLASTEYVDSAIETKIAEMVDSAPEALDTLNELAAALGDDPNFATTIVTGLGQKINTEDIADDLVTEDVTKPLSANQGAVLKALVDAITVPTKVSELTNDEGYVKNTDYATLETAGVIKVATSGNARGVKLGTDNILQVACAEKEDISGKTSHNKPITPVNLEYAVQACTNQDSKAELTEAQLKLPPSTQFVKDCVDDAKTLMVAVTTNADGTVTGDKTATEIITAHKEEKTVIAVVDNSVILPLAQVDDTNFPDDYAASFALMSPDGLIVLDCTNENWTVSVNEVKSDLEPLIVNVTINPDNTATADKNGIEIATAFTEGRNIIIRDANAVFSLIAMYDAGLPSYGEAWFANINGTNLRILWCMGDSWGYIDYTLEQTKNRVTTLDQNNTHSQYPSAKAVVDYVNTTFLGGAW